MSLRLGAAFERLSRSPSPAKADRRRNSGMSNDAAALDAVGRTEGALRIHIALKIAVIARIGIDQAADRAILLRDFAFVPRQLWP